ncbi:hypothetical protein DPX16_3744 [Anabarilius grahami]|uniref:Uncharacterized protein n=1 Tax=Anabarilius grahami TaxID=495550 RepID=A0A3N0XV71_ANAGA|nr:hypothetical protein DPX16_3744 [Anabarilius grahami]
MMAGVEEPEELRCVDSAIASVIDDIDSAFILKEEQRTAIKAFVVFLQVRTFVTQCRFDCREEVCCRARFSVGSAKVRIEGAYQCAREHPNETLNDNWATFSWTYQTRVHSSHCVDIVECRAVMMSLTADLRHFRVPTGSNQENNPRGTFSSQGTALVASSYNYPV